LIGVPRREEEALSDTSNPQVGTIGWVDLTVPNADEVRDFYMEVVGWKSDAAVAALHSPPKEPSEETRG
jgi:catechol-2,3-dioxygenase